MTTTQVAVRLDDELLESLDWLVVRCDYEYRAEVFRTALRDLARRERSRENGEQIADGDRRMPQTPAELDAAGRGGVPGLADEDLVRVAVISQGDIRWLEEPDEQPRPALVLVRDAAVAHLGSLTVAPLTRTIRGIPTEVLLGPEDGVAVESVASFDNLRSVAAPIARGSSARWLPAAGTKCVPR